MNTQFVEIVYGGIKTYITAHSSRLLDHLLDTAQNGQTGSKLHYPTSIARCLARITEVLLRVKELHVETQESIRGSDY